MANKVYNDLSKSPFKVEHEGFELYFSSAFHKNKFIRNISEYIKEIIIPITAPNENVKIILLSIRPVKIPIPEPKAIPFAIFSYCLSDIINLSN